jgi:hypothetical protein
MLIDEYRNAVTGGEDIRVTGGQSLPEDFLGDAVDYSHAFQTSSESKEDIIICNPDRPDDIENLRAFEIRSLGSLKITRSSLPRVAKQTSPL